MESEERIKKFFYSYSGKDHLYDLAPLDGHVHIDTHRQDLLRQFLDMNDQIEATHGLPLQLLISREDKVETCKQIFQRGDYLQNPMVRALWSRFKQGQKKSILWFIKGDKDTSFQSAWQ